MSAPRRPLAAAALVAAAALAAGLLAGAPAGAGAAPTAKPAKVGGGKGGVGLKRVGRFQQPTYVAAAPGEKGVFVVEQPGRIRVLRKGKKQTFLDIRGEVLPGGEQGLLSVAFAPDYQQSGLLYVYYVSNAGDLAIEEYRRASATSADRSSARRVLTINHPGESNHNGGQLQFGPDGFLYIGSGDGGGGGDPDDSAQDTSSLLGKILRIDPRPSGGDPYGSPGSNPFVGDPGRDEIYALGLRNPFRFSFDRVSPKGPHIVIGDVGQDRFEEVDYETVAGARGANFGWNDFEGNSAFNGANPPGPSRHDRPIKVYSLGGGACALIGGYVVASKKLKSVRGRYIYGDFCIGKLRSLVPGLGGAKKDRALGVRVPSLSSFGLGPGGSVYATSLNGPVYKLVGKRKGR
jgi:glucose/arabinose dehydrogenase